MARNGSTALAVADQQKAAVLEQVVIQGDLSKLQPAERVAYYRTVCESVGLNPFTKPFEYINLNGKLTLYAKRDATDQLRKIHGISITRLERDYQDDIYVVTAYGQDREGRVDSATGAVAIAGLKGDARANAIMKAETKAKRRLTLSLAGLGWLDETEVATVPDAAPVDVDMETGEIKTPMRNVTPPRPTSDVKRGDESKREEYHAAVFGYLSEAHQIDESKYVSLIDYACHGTPQKCDIDRLAELARYAYAAAKQGSQTAARHLASIVTDWRSATGPDAGPDPMRSFEGDEVAEQAAMPI